MARKLPKNTLLVDVEWIYSLSALTAESKLLGKHSDKVYELHYTKLEKLVGRCFVDELLKAKEDADSAEKVEGEDWTDKIEQKYLEILNSNDFLAWYSKTLELLVTTYATSELKADGLVKYERQLENTIVSNVSARERKERQDSLLRIIPNLEANLMEHTIKPNVLLFACLKKKFVSVEKVEKFKLDYFSPIAGAKNGVQRPPVAPIIIVQTPTGNERKSHTYNYSASPLDGSFTIDYDDEIDTNGSDISIVVHNSLGQLLADVEYTAYEGEYIKVWIVDYLTEENRTGKITIQVI